MGNQSVRSSDYWGASDCGDGANLQIGHKSKYKSFEPRSKKLRGGKKPKTTKGTANRLTKASRSDFRSIRQLFGDKIPVVLALLAESPYQVRLDKNPAVGHCWSALNNKTLPCDENWRREKSYPCATYCAKCNKKSALRSKRKR